MRRDARARSTTPISRASGLPQNDPTTATANQRMLHARNLIDRGPPDLTHRLQDIIHSVDISFAK